jgi:hypothetical protein
MIKFKLNKNPLMAKKLDINMTLKEARTILSQKIPEACLFVCSDGTEIEREDEEEFKLNDIAEIENNFKVVFLSLKEEKKETKNEINVEKPEKPKEIPSKLEDKGNGKSSQKMNQNNNSNKETPDWLTEEKKNNESVLTDTDNSNFNQNNHQENPNLDNLNQQNKKNTIKKNTQNKDEIPPPAVSNNINKNIDNNNKKVLKFDKNELSKYKCIEKHGNLKIYLYPSCKFSDKEEMNALTFMVVGETGCIKLHYLIVLLMLF